MRKCLTMIATFLLLANAQVVMAADVTTSSLNYAISSNMTIEQIAENVRAALPAGTPLAKIDAYFTSNGIEHSYFSRTNRVLATATEASGCSWEKIKLRRMR